MPGPCNRRRCDTGLALLTVSTSLREMVQVALTAAFQLDQYEVQTVNNPKHTQYACSNDMTDKCYATVLHAEKTIDAEIKKPGDHFKGRPRLSDSAMQLATDFVKIKEICRSAVCR